MQLKAAGFFVIGTLIIFLLAGCLNAVSTAAEITPTSFMPDVIRSPLADYEFPTSIDPAKRYLFYLHGKIIEDQGLPAVSPDYGKYEYEEILKKFANYGFVVVSEQRPKNTDGMEYAKKISGQVSALLNTGVPEKNITIVGASKGAGIAMEISNLLENEEINFVFLGGCNFETVDYFRQNQKTLHGNVLSIYDSVDEFAGSCEELFAFSEGKGLGRHDEIILYVGTGHGILYKPLDEWILPSVQWAQQ